MTDGQVVTVTPFAPRRAPGARWSPELSRETQDLLEHLHLPVESRAAVTNAAAEILSRGIEPDARQSRATGLVVGYVQSGKTLSFTSVAALARDNGFQIVIVIAGTSDPLLDQSTRRLRRDLRLDDMETPRPWMIFTNPGDDDTNRRSIQNTIDDWLDPHAPEAERKTILITVMKNHRHLVNLTSLLRRIDLGQVPSLIIDDEADQASLNTQVRQGRQSTTYRRLLALRDALPVHTFLQYTATPQAPLLINIIDTLSPSFVQVLAPGNNYVGGTEFFGHGSPYVRVIPPQEVPTQANPLTAPPPSLLEALKVFIVGVAAGIIEGKRPPRRSMLVHPSQRTVHHQDYYRWIGDAFSEWRRVLEQLPAGDADRADLLEQFRATHADLATTAPNVPPWAAIERQLPRAFRNIRIQEVNARRGETPRIDWPQTYAWILVGGQAMDRGFTVEGLTVTYMPRGPGVGNADTLQQRARFFGYKRDYLGYCRVYLEQAALTAFEEYVDHEEDIRTQLEQVQLSGEPLADWKRTFVLSPQLQPCRNNVLQYNVARGNYADRWFYPHLGLAPDDVLTANRDTVSTFVRTLQFATDAWCERPEEAQRHVVCREVSLERVVRELVVPLRVTGAADTQEYLGVLLQLSHALEGEENELCTVYQMSPGYRRHRAVNVDGEINELFQGPTRLSGGGYSYPGDAAFRDVDRITIQIHRLDLKHDGTTEASDVPVVAIWVPRRMAIPWAVQHQPRR